MIHSYDPLTFDQRNLNYSGSLLFFEANAICEGFKTVNFVSKAYLDSVNLCPHMRSPVPKVDLKKWKFFRENS
jgi:hypothetical protein